MSDFSGSRMPNGSLLMLASETGLSVSVKSFGRRQAYESPRGRHSEMNMDAPQSLLRALSHLLIRRYCIFLAEGQVWNVVLPQ